MKNIFKICVSTALILLISITGISTALADELKEFTPDNNDSNIARFGLTNKSSFKSAELLGVQANKENLKSVRFVSAALSEQLKNADDYGYIFNIVSEKIDINEVKNNPEKYTDGNSTVISCKNTENSVAFGKYGNAEFETASQGYTRYKYITAAVKNIPDDKILIARFYTKKDGTEQYADYKGSGAYCVINNETFIANIKSSIEIIAHRGARDSAPENTIAAFEEAGKQGYDSVEADFWVANNGDLLILHNKTINGTNIQTITAETRTNYPIAGNFATKELEEQYGQQYIPTLEEVVMTVSKYKMNLYLHTKDDNTSESDFKKIVTILNKYNMKDRTSIFSKNMTTCRRIQAQGVRTGYIISEPSTLISQAAVNSCIKNQVDFFMINNINGFPSDKNISELHSNGIKIGIYNDLSVNTNGTLQFTLGLISRGIDFTVVNNKI